MSLLNFILNLAGLLIWIGGWAAFHQPPGNRPVSPAAASFHLNRKRSVKTWLFPAGLGALLLCRSVFYHQLGTALGWVAETDLGVISLQFRSGFGFFGRMLAFSVLSFLEFLGVFYLCLLFVSLLDLRPTEPGPEQKFVRFQLGRVGRWPWHVKVLLPVGGMAAFWCLASPLFIAWDIVPHPRSWWQVPGQSIVLGTEFLLRWKYPATLLLLLYVLNSYIYFGNHSFWSFVDQSGRVLLSPLRRLPLRWRKMDFAPFAALAAVVAAHFADSAQYTLQWLFRRWLL